MKSANALLIMVIAMLMASESSRCAVAAETRRRSIAEVLEIDKLCGSYAQFQDVVGGPKYVEPEEWEAVGGSAAATAAGGNVFKDPFPRITRALEQQEPFESCAVVGTSGLASVCHFGPLIDRTEAVFRPNISPVHGFHEHVGSRTDVRLLYTLGAFANSEGVGTPTHYSWGKKGGAKAAAPAEPGAAVDETVGGMANYYTGENEAKVLVLNADHRSPFNPKQAADVSKGKRRVLLFERGKQWLYTDACMKKLGMQPGKGGGESSSGIKVAMLAMFACERVQFFNFWPFSHWTPANAVDPKPVVLPYHYYAPNVPHSWSTFDTNGTYGGYHSFISEYSILLDFAHRSTGLMEIVQPDPFVCHPEPSAAIQERIKEFWDHRNE